jgi:hypothetical protein
MRKGSAGLRYRPEQLAVDSGGNLYILNMAQFGRYLFRLDVADGLLHLVYPSDGSH